MNANIWRNTRSNDLLFHAFPEGKALCNSRITPNDGDYVTAEQAKAQPMTHLCERCEKALAKKARKETVREAVKTLPASEVHTIADTQGRVIYIGNANTHKRADLRWTQRATVKTEGVFVTLIDDRGEKIIRVRNTTRLYVAAVPTDYDKARAAALEAAEAAEVTMAEVSAPVAQAEAPARVRDVVAEDVTQASVDAYLEREYPALSQLDADEPATAQDIADADLASGECEWTDAQVADAAAALADRAAASGMRLVTPEELETLAGATGEVFWGGMGERPASSAARVRVVRHGVTVHLVDVETGTSAGNVHTLKSWAAPVEPGEAPQALTLTQEARSEAADIARARAQAERLRNRNTLEKSVPLVKAHANFRDLSVSGNTTAAKRYWARRCDEFVMVETVKAHALANYDLGWDTIVECYSDEEILEFCRESNADTVAEAIAAFRELTDVWAERQCGALVDGYGV